VLVDVRDHLPETVFDRSLIQAVDSTRSERRNRQRLLRAFVPAAIDSALAARTS